MPNRWLIVFSASLISLVGFGSRGVFGVVYVEMLKEFHWDRAALAGVYSVGMLLMGFGGPLAGSLSRKIGFKRYYLISGLLVGLTFFLASRVQTLAQVYWTYGLLGGLSLAALGFGPTQGLVARWFDTRRGLLLQTNSTANCRLASHEPPRRRDLRPAQLRRLIQPLGWEEELLLLVARSLQQPRSQPCRRRDSE